MRGSKRQSPPTGLESKSSVKLERYVVDNAGNKKSSERSGGRPKLILGKK